MSPDDFEDIPDEEIPESLQKKWDNEDFESEMLEKKFVYCPQCKKRTPAKVFSCLYCGTRVFYNSGLLGYIVSLCKRDPLRVFDGKYWWTPFAVFAAGFLIVLLIAVFLR